MSPSSVSEVLSTEVTAVSLVLCAEFMCLLGLAA